MLRVLVALLPPPPEPPRVDRPSGVRHEVPHNAVAALTPYQTETLAMASLHAAAQANNLTNDDDDILKNSANLRDNIDALMTPLTMVIRIN